VFGRLAAMRPPEHLGSNAAIGGVLVCVPIRTEVDSEHVAKRLRKAERVDLVAGRQGTVDIEESDVHKKGPPERRPFR